MVVLVVMIVVLFGVIMVVRCQLKARQQSGMQDRGVRFENNAYEGEDLCCMGREKEWRIVCVMSTAIPFD